jgi:hypothetical protein
MDSHSFFSDLKNIKKEITAEKERLKSNLKELSQTEKQVQKVLSLLASKQYCALFQMLQEKKQLIPANVSEQLAQFIQAELKTLWKSYPALLEEAFLKSGLELDKTSRHPQYSVFDSLLQIEIEENNCLASIRSLSGKTFTCPADVNSVSAMAKKHYQRLTNLRFEPQDFLQKLHSAYQKARLEKENMSFIPIKKVFSHFDRKKYAMDEFTLDFSRLLQSGIKKIDEEYLEIQHCKDENQGIMLYGISPRLLIGAICFKGKQNDERT